MHQLEKYVTTIASLYRSNPFHNFEHASHVTISINKLLQRVTAPSRASEISAQASPVPPRRRSMLENMSLNISVHSDDGKTNKVKSCSPKLKTSPAIKKQQQQQIASDLHNYTYGITSDPLTQFAVVFGALIHDCDHGGVSNAQLVKERDRIAAKYNNKSVMEQNSFDLAWSLFMDENEYGALHECLFSSDNEYHRFRQVVINVVMATDIYDAELVELREKRWNKAFNNEGIVGDDIDAENRKATIVIEHLMQASDVAHTMQHWHIYQKWNRRLFDEMYTAYLTGRLAFDPSQTWYTGELKFLNGYVIPLAKKLKDCNVFGVASDECLTYAENNKKEWESKGEQIVTELVANFLQREAEEKLQIVELQERKGRSSFARRRSLITTGG
jgi:3'5'-cyclic nucleotide phosphodiesterase